MVSQLIKCTVEGDNQFTSLLPFLLVGAVVVLAVAGVALLNMALQLFDAIVLVPTYYTLNLISIVTGGFLMYQEYDLLGKTVGPIRFGRLASLLMAVLGIAMCKCATNKDSPWSASDDRPLSARLRPKQL